MASEVLSSIGSFGLYNQSLGFGYGGDKVAFYTLEITDRVMVGDPTVDSKRDLITANSPLSYQRIGQRN